MKKLLPLIVVFLFLISCNTRKQVEKHVNSGNYNYAITKALNKLKTNKNKKRKRDYVLMLRDAFHKAANRDLNTINHLKKDNNPELYKKIHELYLDLNSRQESIKPVLPLVINNKVVSFKFNDYTNSIINSRNKASNYLYNKGLDLTNLSDKHQIRESYRVFKYIESINPNYRRTRSLIESAHRRGTAHVKVSIENNTQQIIPKRLEDDLLNFNTYGLNQFWIAYHANSNNNIDYDYAMKLKLKRINISPEHVREQEIIREKEIVDGWEYQLDSKGNVAKDSLGNDIKVDKIVFIRAYLSELTQIKSTQIIADVVYEDIKSNQLLDTFTINSEFIFENIFAALRGGDERALNAEDVRIMNNPRVPFPSNEQMVFDTGEDLKIKLKNIISSFKIR